MTARNPRAWLAALLSPAGRIGRGTFALAVVAVYAAWYATPFALTWINGRFEDVETFPSPELLIGVAVYPLVAALTYVSFCVHRKRLADARRTALSFGLLVVASFGAVIVGLLISLASAPPAVAHNGVVAIDATIDLRPEGSWIQAWPLLVFLAAWPLYSLWVGLAPSRPAAAASPSADL